jgi:hypothetical protein
MFLLLKSPISTLKWELIGRDQDRVDYNATLRPPLFPQVKSDQCFTLLGNTKEYTPFFELPGGCRRAIDLLGTSDISYREEDDKDLR